jgi:hypothetical protein
MVVSGAFAWFRARDAVTNHLEGNQFTDGSVSLVEVFTPPETWQPGQSVTKQAAVANNGMSEALVRVSFTEAASLYGSIFYTGTPYQTGDNIMPQFFNPKGILGNSEWKDPAAVFGENVSGIPANVTVRVKEVKGAQGESSYGFVAWSDITAEPFIGRAQAVTATFKVSGNALTVSGVLYWGNTGKTYDGGPKVDWTVNKPASALTSLATPVVKFGFDDPSGLEAQAPQAGKWWYNKADGWFYYIGLLPPGDMTPLLLKSLSMSNDSREAGMYYDLTLKMEALQPLQAALTASGQGWGLDPSSPLMTALKPFYK